MTHTPDGPNGSVRRARLPPPAGPLPISLAYFRGTPAALAGNPALYTSSNFRSSTFTNQLDPRDPNVFSFASALDANSGRRANALAAGLAPNFLVANPDKLGGAQVTGNGGYTNYHSMQVELRRRMSQGLQFQMSYVWGRAYLSDFYSFRVPRVESLDTGAEGGVAHAFKVNWVYELPFGQGRRFGGNVGRAMDLLIGGWQIHGIGRFQSGEILDFGNLRMVGFDINDLRDMYGVRKDADGIITYLPDDMIENTIRAFSTDPGSPTGYSALGVPEGRYFAPSSGPDCLETIADSTNRTGFGDCGERNIEINGQMFKNLDISVVKAVPIAGRVRAEFRVEMLNAFDWVNFNPAATFGDELDDYRINGLIGSPRIIQLVSRASW